MVNTICFCLFGRLGDICCGIPAVKALRKKYPKAEITWVTVKGHDEIVPKFTKVRFHGSLPYGSGWPKWANENEFDLVIKAQPAFRHKEWSKSKKHAVDLIAQWSGVILAPDDRVIDIATTPEDEEAIKKFELPKAPFATICCGRAISAHNYWHDKHMQQVVNKLSPTMKFVAIGGKDGVAIKGAKNIIGQTSFRETVALIRKSKLYIGPDNGCTWLACAARNTAKICVMNKNRLKDGVVGFQNYLSDKNIKDVFLQDGIDNIVSAAKVMWKR